MVHSPVVLKTGYLIDQSNLYNYTAHNVFECMRPHSQRGTCTLYSIMQAVNTHSKHTSVLTHERFAGLPQLHAVTDIARYSEVLSGLVHNVFGHGG